MNKKPATNQRRTGLARVLSKLGCCSRTQGASLVRAGRVTVNGAVHRDPEFPVREGDRLTVDGYKLNPPTSLYLAMNKPRGLVTTASDEKGRPTVYSLLDPNLPWVAPVGRLDQASEGLLLFSNDTDWAARVASPASHLPKTYHVQIATVATEALLAQLANGIRCDGNLLRAAKASVLRGGTKNSWLEIVLEEGRNRHIRRMLAAVGIDVLRLIRISIGPLALGDLKKGKVRQLTIEEKLALDRALAPSR